MYTLVIICHVIAAMIWVGGGAFIGLALLPATRGLDPVARLAIISKPARRFRKIGWGALAVLVLTGGWLFYSWGGFSTPGFFEAPSHRLLGLKMVLVLLLLVLSGIHDWYLGPKVTAALKRGEDPGPIRAWNMRLGQSTMVLTLIIVVLAVLLARPALLAQ